ncbi:MAG: UDP-N-acetylmuramate dehydrogenase [Patescibacteria group bacterium]|jgi:UDP-N-acetylmuramate dehydrogenase
MEIKQNILLKDYTTFKIGGPADYFCLAKSQEDVQEAIDFAKEKNLAILVLGGGSNLLITDAGFRGLVIKLDLQKLEYHDDEVIVGAGVLVAYLLNKSLEQGLTGLEFTAGIPGTVGGAIRGNAGTYGLAMSNVIETITYFDENYQVKVCQAEECHFAYRHSIFKEIKAIIIEAKLKLEKGDLGEAQKLVAERLKYRQDTQPNEPSAGCIFKNVEFKTVDIEDLKKRGLDTDQFAKHQKIPTAYIIERAGLKGHTIGGVKVSEKHANYIINTNKATAEQVIMLISFIKQQIRDKYGIQLQEEVQFIG